MSTQAVRFCTSFDRTRVAFAVSGTGPPLVKAPHWLTHLEQEFLSPLWKPWIASLSKQRKLLRMDQRGCGLSDWDVGELTFDAYVRDMEAVVDAAGFSAPFALFGHSQGAAVAIAYAVRNPERVSHLVILGGYARGNLQRGLAPERVAEFEALIELVKAGWGREDPSYRQMFAMQFVPDATLEQINSLSGLQRATSTPENAARIVRSFYDINVTASARDVRCPTLILHARGDRRVPFEEGRLLAGLIPGARFVPLETDNHILLPHEAAFADFFGELDAFLPGAEHATASAAFSTLTTREGEILTLIARGLDNAQIAAHLGLAEKTVRNNITHIFDKLQVESRAQAIVLARDHGLGTGERRGRTHRDVSPAVPRVSGPVPGPRSHALEARSGRSCSSPAALPAWTGECHEPRSVDDAGDIPLRCLGAARTSGARSTLRTQGRDGRIHSRARGRAQA